MNAVQTVFSACQTQNLQKALEAHEVLMSVANRAYQSIQKENCSTEDYAHAQRVAVNLHDSACMIQSTFDVEVSKFPSLS